MVPFGRLVAQNKRKIDAQHPLRRLQRDLQPRHRQAHCFPTRTSEHLGNAPFVSGASGATFTKFTIVGSVFGELGERGTDPDDQFRPHPDEDQALALG